MHCLRFCLFRFSRIISFQARVDTRGVHGEIEYLGKYQVTWLITVICNI